MTIDTRRIAEWIASVDASAAPPATVDRVRLQLASMVASVLDGIRLPDVAASREAWAGASRPVRRGPRAKPAALDGEALAPWWAMASMALDFDDYLLFAHAGHSAVNVALALGLERDATLGETLAAVLAADELGGRLGGYTLLGPHNGQLWTHVHLGGAVAAAARLARDDPAVLERALGLAFANPPFLVPPAFFGGGAKLLAAAVPIRQAFLALRLARATSLSAPAGTLGADDGLGRHFSHAPLEGFLEGFGEVWLTDTLAVKRVPGCAYAAAAAEAACAAARQFREAKGRAVLPGDVERVEVSATALTAAMDEAARPYRGSVPSAIDVNFSTGLTVAVALIDGVLEPRALDAGRLRRDGPDLLAVAGRVTVRHDLARTMRFIDGVVRPMELLDALGDLRGDSARKVGWEILRRYPGALRPGAPGGATRERSPFDLLADGGSFEALRSVGQLVAGALGKRREGVRYSVSRARPADVRFAASAGILATLAGEVFEGECEVPAGAPGAALDIDDVVREKTARAFRGAGVAADAEAFVGRLLGAPPETPLRELAAPVLPALGVP